MHKGAVVMMDALGFKALSLEHPDAVRRKMHRLVKNTSWVSLLAEEMKKHGYASTPQVTFLSDTIVVGIPLMMDDVGFTIALAALSAGAIVLAAGRGSHPLVYRGCISFGDYEMTPPFILGPAVNDAAEHYEVAELAAVWLSPTALSTWTKPREQMPPNIARTLHPWSIPLKGGGSFASVAINPFASGKTSQREDREKWIGSVLATFRGPLPVHVKRQNTERFLLALHERPDADFGLP